MKAEKTHDAVMLPSVFPIPCLLISSPLLSPHSWSLLFCVSPVAFCQTADISQRVRYFRPGLYAARAFTLSPFSYVSHVPRLVPCLLFLRSLSQSLYISGKSW